MADGRDAAAADLIRALDGGVIKDHGVRLRQQLLDADDACAHLRQREPRHVLEPELLAGEGWLERRVVRHLDGTLGAYRLRERHGELRDPGLKGLALVNIDRCLVAINGDKLQIGHHPLLVVLGRAQGLCV